MRPSTNMTVLDLSWDGPYRLDEIAQFNAGPDYGIYQIYGTHGRVLSKLDCWKQSS
jgi:hypothetical protein